MKRRIALRLAAILPAVLALTPVIGTPAAAAASERVEIEFWTMSLTVVKSGSRDSGVRSTWGDRTAQMTSLTRILRLDQNSSLPLYQQLQRALREAIETRVLGPDDALPSERQLATDLDVSRITVRKAIDALAADGFLVRRQGSGNFVCARIDKNFAKLTSFSEDMRSRGRSPHSVWLKRAEGTVNPEEALKLALSPGTLVYRFHRVRYADDAPMAIETATIVASCLPSLEAVGDSLYEALERGGNRPVRALQRLRALLLTGEQARLLDAREADAGLLVERLGYLRDGRAVELTQSCYRGDAYDFVAELNAAI